MGDGDKVHLSPEDIREQARGLVKDAADFSRFIEDSRQGLRSAGVDAAPWFSAGGWGMFNKPAAAAAEAETFISQVSKDMEDKGIDLHKIVKVLADVDINNSTELDELGKVINRHE